MPHLLAVEDAAVVALATADADGVRAWARALDPGGETLRVAAGRPVTSIEAIAESRRDARLALEAAARDAVALFEEIPLAGWLVGMAPAAALGAKLRDVLGPLEGHRPLLDTLRAYLRHDAGVAEAAAGLGLHQSSVRYRLGRIEQLLGCSLRDLSVLTELHLAVLAA